MSDFWNGAKQLPGSRQRYPVDAHQKVHPTNVFALLWSSFRHRRPRSLAAAVHRAPDPRVKQVGAPRQARRRGARSERPGCGLRLGVHDRSGGPVVAAGLPSIEGLDQEIDDTLRAIRNDVRRDARISNWLV